MGYSEIRSRLLNGEVVEYEGVHLRMIPEKDYGGKLEVGDKYFAQRNSGPKLLTVKKVVDRYYAEKHGFSFSGWVEPEELAYSYDFHECVGVEILVKCDVCGEFIGQNDAVMNIGDSMEVILACSTCGKEDA